MDYKGHMLSTFIMAVLALYFLNIPANETAMLWLIIALGASLLPDLDLENSKANQLLNPVIFAISLAISFFVTKDIFFLVTLAIIIFSLYRLIIRISANGHRGHFHTVYFAIFLATPVYIYAGLFLATAVVFGIGAHLIEDFFHDVMT